MARYTFKRADEEHFSVNRNSERIPRGLPRGIFNGYTSGGRRLFMNYLKLKTKACMGAIAFSLVWLVPYSGLATQGHSGVEGVHVHQLAHLFFERTWKIYQGILMDRQAIRDAHQKVLSFNQNLETMVTDRTRALAVSEHKYRRIFEVSKDMILVAQKNGRILHLNPAGCRMLGIEGPVQEFLEQQPHVQDHLFQFSDWAHLMDSIEKHGSITGEELDLKSAGGSGRKVALSAV